MIVLDTHIWIWWMTGDTRLTTEQSSAIAAHLESGIAICVISCWELAMLVQRKRIVLSLDVEVWLNQALSHPALKVVDLSPRLIVESVRLPGDFHRDPADQLIVATARMLGCPLVAVDEKILAYPHVTCI